MLNLKMFITRNSHKIISLIIAICIWLVTNMILEFVVPGPIYMEESSEPYYAKRALVGLTTFLVAMLVLPVFNKTKMNSFFRNIYIAIAPMSLRFIFAGYFAMFWYNFLIDIWFSRISLSFAYTLIDSHYYPIWFGCLSIICTLGMFWVIFEPWKKSTFPKQDIFLLWRFLPARVTVYLALSIYFAMFMFLRFPTDIVFVISGTIILIIGSAFCVKFYLLR